MAGWNLKYGALHDENIGEDQYWSLFNFVFSDGSRKRNTYKYGLIKSILDNLFNGTETNEGFYIPYRELFAKFAENYWNLVVKYDLRQMRKDGKSDLSKIELTLKEALSGNTLLRVIEFDAIDESQKRNIINKVMQECKRFVLGALYEDFEGALYSFALADDGIYLSFRAREFLLKYKTEIERLNYYSWAKFLEQINDDNVLIRVIDKLELATPKRSNLSIYREILQREFEDCNCFYCGKKIKSTIHVDHLIPWAFVKDDKVWNFVLACPTCNKKKNCRVPEKEYVIKVEMRNKKLMHVKHPIVETEFEVYSEHLLSRMWEYAKMSGIKEFRV